MRNKLIRLTESDLHRIVKESVNKVLNEMVDEGQGWDFFNRVRRDYKNGDQDLDDYNQAMRDKETKVQARNFINTGDYKGDKGNVYDRDHPASSDSYYKSMDHVKSVYGDDKEAQKEYGAINHSLGGKLGRAAGYYGARGYMEYQNLKNNLKNKFRKK